MLRLSKAILRTNCPLNRKICTSTISRGVWEPDYINQPPEIPEYQPLNIQLRGYDYVTLESFARYAHRLSDRLGLDVEVYPVPPRTNSVNVFKPNSTKVADTYKLSNYERIIRLLKMPSNVAPILLDTLQCNMPEGVSMTVKEPQEDEDEFRYVPDLMLQDLFQQVAEIDKTREDRKKK
ncbi:DgyrCDS11733 [Dimorphilus gyrociliatus]|uniref:DgyrCDS11733 n=1 Tax=Dimorphilus gyrociliatus TaxID=2664684 RepID=A0A7I8W6U1_9ANNE|nr:DgyrCDS11733 [Dimorphilus gyrociliatus]